MKPIISGKNLAKQYRIGKSQAPYATLRDTLAAAVRAPLRYLRGHRAEPAETFWALKDVSFDVMPGDVVGIIGRNGAGKSTLLKILSRITEPTDGTAAVNGRLGSLLEVGTGFHHELTGRENIFLNGAILGMARREILGKFDDIVAFAEVEQFIDTPVKHFSSGMYTRLAFSVAAHLQPEILVIDEVLAVGDIEFQKKCVGRMEHVARSGSAVIMVSHNMGTVRSLCTKAILLEKGMTKVQGAPETVVSAYLAGGRADPVERVISDGDYLCGGGKLRIEKIRLLHPALKTFTVYWKQPISVGLELNVLEPLEDISLGAGVRLPDGNWFCCFHHDDWDANPRLALKPGKYFIKFTMANDLKPGIYKLEAGAHHYHYGKTLCAVHAANLEILDHTREGLSPTAYNPGFVNGSASWEGPVALAR